jgi:hypothetical protein
LDQRQDWNAECRVHSLVTEFDHHVTMISVSSR